MTSLAERLNYALTEGKKTNPSLTKAKLAKHCGVRPSTVTDWFSGTTRSINGPDGFKAAEFFAVSPAWLISGLGEPHDGTTTNVETPEKRFIGIPEYELRLSSKRSGTAVDFVALGEDHKGWYARDWLKERNLNPADCKRIRVKDSSMEPLIWDGDIILLDCSPQKITSGKIYAFSVGTQLHVKYLYPMLDGSIVVKSLNPAIPDEKINASDFDKFQLIGRVRDRTGDRFF